MKDALRLGCLLLGLTIGAVVVIMAGITSTLAILQGDMGGWSFWIGATVAMLIIYGSRV